MILELLEFCLTPCSWEARVLGFLRSSIQVRARHARCGKSWQPHLEKTKEVILRAAQTAPGRRRAILFGAGLVHDVPLRELSGLFEEVLLVDMVHTWPCRIAAAGLGNVRLVSLDVTGIVSELARVRTDAAAPLPVSKPAFALRDDSLDFSVSLNLLSQLAWVPSHFLGRQRQERDLQAMKRQMVEAHLAYLTELPGRSVLITDTVWHSRPVRSSQNKTLSVSSAKGEWDVLGGVSLPRSDLAWEWDIAPAPERASDADFVARVQAYLDWKSVWPPNG